MNELIRTFLDRLDQELLPIAKGEERFELFLLGRAALVVSYRFPLFTNDIDIVSSWDSELERKAIALSGKESLLAKTLGLYLDPVSPGLPPLPSGFRNRCESIPGDWKVLRLWKLEVHDLAVSKLKSFRPRDREDLQALCDRGLLNPAKLRESLQEAFPFKSPKEEDADEDPDNPDWEKAVTHLKRVEGYLKGLNPSI